MAEIIESTAGIQGPAGPGSIDCGGFVSGALAVSQIIGGWLVPRAGTITNVRAKVTTAPSGSACAIELRKNGVSIASLSIAVGMTDSGLGTLSSAVAEGDRIELVVTAANGAATVYWGVKGSAA
jgi:hypothetical protein